MYKHNRRVIPRAAIGLYEECSMPLPEMLIDCDCYKYAFPMPTMHAHICSPASKGMHVGYTTKNPDLDKPRVYHEA